MKRILSVLLCLALLLTMLTGFATAFAAETAAGEVYTLRFDLNTTEDTSDDELFEYPYSKMRVYLEQKH